MKMKRMMAVLLCVVLMGSIASAGVLTTGTVEPTAGVISSGGTLSTNYTRIFEDGNRTDGNEGRGNSFLAPAGGTMDALVIKKNGSQTFATGDQLTLYVFESTIAMWDLGDGQSDGDLFDGTGITAIYSETFALDGAIAAGDYVTLTLDAPITLAADMGFFIKSQMNGSANTYFQLFQDNDGDIVTGGEQLQSVGTYNHSPTTPLQYYVTGVVPEPATMALLGLGSLIAIRRKR